MKVEVAVLGSPSLILVIVLMVSDSDILTLSVDVKKY